MKIGFGYDVHKLVKKRPLIIGGVLISHVTGLLGWSDADVLTHAIIDALIGAIGEGDIGRHFPPGEEKYKGADSLKLLTYIGELVRSRNFAVNNIDATIVAEEPKFAPYIAQMKQNIAKALDIAVALVNIKGKTEEGLGFTGTKKGIAAYAVCLVHKNI
ncbi:2-C-methyl-D-erythritol 2,4-cyclodiphosphate synthase [Candidatus Saganbacteria bacterium]|nr:2-C-methyl-D-erythritol 2,4-cyclodiphosphate synthase [Candidatus Saganbacteria bacterium]